MDTTPVNRLERQAAMDFAHRLTTLRKHRSVTQQALADTKHDDSPLAEDPDARSR